MIISKEQAIAQNLKRYFTGVPCKNGHISERKISGKCLDCLKEKSSRYYYLNVDVAKKASVEWRKKSGKGYSYLKKYRENNLGVANFYNKKRTTSKQKRTPSWLNKAHLFEIQSIYLYCDGLRRAGFDYHVDHIIPLNGKNVSGLHVPWNLQVIPAKLNLQKGNNFDYL